MQFNILSLDPMYNNLHSEIAQALPQGKRFSLLSSFGFNHYLKGFEHFYISQNIKKISPLICNISKDLNFHYKAKVEKIECRDLTAEELNYFNSYKQLVRQFIIEREIRLVLLHNDLRWNHAIAIEVCKELGVKYLVTEQGLFRPYTTVIDSNGVNANSSVKELFSKRNDLVISSSKHAVTCTHDSARSKLNFLFFIFLHKLGDFLGANAKFPHNDFSMSKYLKRYILQRKKGTPANQIQKNFEFNDGVKYIYFPMQLSNDTQLLVHSPYSSFHEILKQVESAIYNSKSDYVLLVKKHPNDLESYSLDHRTIMVEGNNAQYISNSELVISVNSSVCFEVLSSSTPLVTLGDAFFNIDGIAKCTSLSKLGEFIDREGFKEEKYSSKEKKEQFLCFLKNTYSLQGAGYDNPDFEIKRVLRNLGVQH